MDISIAALSTVVLQLFKLYETGRDAWQTPGFGQEELRLVKELAEGLAKLRQSDNSTASSIYDQQTALITTAFVRSYRSHWMDSRRLLAKQRSQQEAAVKHALVKARVDWQDVPREVSAIAQLLGSPLGTRHYTELWSAFTRTDEPLLQTGVGTSKKEFEASFCATYASLMASPASKAFAHGVAGLAAKRTEQIRMLIAQDTLSWMNRHVLGNVREHSCC